MSTQPKTLITPDEYLAIERKASHKSEYYRGQMYLMAGTSYRHSQIIHNLHVALDVAAKSGCSVVSNDLRVRISETGLYTYPDVVIVCGKPEFVDGEMDTLTNPTVLIEVLSESTAGYDRGMKAWHYRRLPSLRSYLLVSQHEAAVEVHARQDDGSWVLREVRGLDGMVEILGNVVEMDAVYRGVEFAGDGGGSAAAQT